MHQKVTAKSCKQWLHSILNRIAQFLPVARLSAIPLHVAFHPVTCCTCAESNKWRQNQSPIVFTDLNNEINLPRINQAHSSILLLLNSLSGNGTVKISHQLEASGPDSTGASLFSGMCTALLLTGRFNWNQL